MKSLSYFIFVIVTTWVGSEYLIHEANSVSKTQFELQKITPVTEIKLKSVLDTIDKNNSDTEKNLKAAKLTLNKLKNEHPILN